MKRLDKMKKYLGVVTVVLVLLLTSCSSNDLDKALNKMEKLDSYTMRLVNYDVPLFGDIEMVVRIDGEYMMMNMEALSDYDFYSKIVDGQIYDCQYTSEATCEWGDEPSEEQGNVLYHEYFDADDFEVNEEGIWYQVSEKIETEDEDLYIKEAVIVVSDDGYIASIYFQLVSNGNPTTVGIDYSDINNTTITLPGEE